jgi:hypothetical protein
MCRWYIKTNIMFLNIIHRPFFYLKHVSETGECWKETKVLQIESNTTHRKYKESSHMSVIDHPISQPISAYVITAEVKRN